MQVSSVQKVRLNIEFSISRGGDMWQKVLSLADYFIPRYIASDPSLHKLSRQYQGVARMLLTVIIIMSVFTITLMLFGKENSNIVFILLMIVALVSFSLLAMFLFHTILIPLLVANIGSVILMVYGMTITGGLFSPFLFMVLTLPVITITFGDDKIFISLCIAITLSILGLFSAHSLGVIPNPPATYLTVTEQFLCILGAFTLSAIGGILAKKEIQRGRYELRLAKETAEQEARIDMLTGLINRRAFVEVAEKMIARAERNSYKETIKSYDRLFLAMIDVDLFKQINDTYGHAIGDLVLTKIADAFKKDSRNLEPVSRVGGEEFAILFESDNEENACLAAERFRVNVERLDITIDQQKIPVTISIGITVCHKTDDLDTLLNRADEALYLAKKQGRNCVTLKAN